MIKRIKTHSIRALFWSLLIFAISITGLRFALFELNFFKTALENQLSKQLGAPVTIGKIRGVLSGLKPELALQQIQVHSQKNKETNLHLQEIHLGIDLWAALHSPMIESLQISLIGAKLSVKRLKTGSIAIQGLPHKEDDPQPTWLMQGKQYKLIDSEINWQDEKRHALPVLLKHVNIAIYNQAGQHKVFIDTELPKSLGESLKLSMIFSGDIFTPETIEAKLFVQGENIKLDEIITGDLPFDLSIIQGHGDFSIWSSWRAAQMTKMSGSLHLAKTVIKSTTNQPFPIEQLDLKFNLQKQQEKWLLAIENSLLSSQNINFGLSQLALALTHNAEGELTQIALNCPRLDLGRLNKIATINKALPTNLQQTLNALDISGEAKDLLFLANLPEQTFSINGQLEQIKFNAMDKLPGIKGLSLYISGNEQQGEIQLSSQNLTLNAPNLFRTPLDFTLALGELHWQQLAKHWIINSPMLEMKSVYLAIKNKLQLTLAKSEQPPFMTLQSVFDIYDASKTPDFLPAGILEKDLANWLDNAFLAGHVEQGGILFRGALPDYPFIHQEGAFEVLYDAQDITLNYAPDWPNISNLSGQAHFFAESMELNILQGQTYGTSIKQAKVSIDSFTHSDYLDIQGAISGDFAQGIDFLKQSPFKKETTSVSDLLGVHGIFDADVNLKIPLKKAPLKINLALKTQKAQADIIPARLKLTDINAQFHITESSIKSNTLSAKTLGFPIRAKINSHAKGTFATIAGLTDIAHLNQQHPNPLWEYFSGAGHYQITLDMPSDTSRSATIELNSDLKGINIDLAPFSKPDNQAHPLNLKLEVAESGITSLNASYENRLSPNNSLTINLKKITPHWQGLVQSPLASGSVFIPIEFNKQANMSLLLNNLDLSALQQMNTKKSDSAFSIQDFPALNIQSKSLYWQGQNLGQLELLTQPSPNGLLIKKLALSTPKNQLSLAGNWQQQGSSNKTEIKGTLLSENFGQLLHQNHLSENIVNTTADIQFALDWDNAPYAFSSTNLSGTLDLHMTNGRILGVNPGLGRILGALDIWKLSKRLRLDFSDITEEGLSFSEINATINLDKGLLSSNNFYINAMPAKINVSGTTHLDTKQINLSATVLPKFPIAGTIIGNVANSVTKTFTGDEHAGGLLLSLLYKITGTWENFSVDRQFDRATPEPLKTP
ncbi:MAG: DUF3971 domain-containing protein [Methyloprofundus sp.]|nr:DUF3971 domain-containing protein [Methyloprofundus sp.]